MGLAVRAPDLRPRIYASKTKEIQTCKHNKQMESQSQRHSPLIILTTQPLLHQGTPSPTPLFHTTIRAVDCRFRARFNQGSTVDLALHS